MCRPKKKKTRLPCQQPLYASQMPHRGLTIQIISAVMGNHMFSSVAATAAVVRSSLNYYCHLSLKWNRNSAPTCIKPLSPPHVVEGRWAACRCWLLETRHRLTHSSPLVTTRCSSLVHHASKPFFLSWWESEAILPVSEILSARNMLIKMELLYSSSRVITLPH